MEQAQQHKGRHRQSSQYKGKLLSNHTKKKRVIVLFSVPKNLENQNILHIFATDKKKHLLTFIKHKRR